MKIYTKRGDHGETDLFGGERVLKTHIRVKAYGEIDAANSSIGVAYSAPKISDEVKVILCKIMKLMFCAGAEVATAPKESAQHILERELKNRINTQHIAWLESAIDSLEGRLNPLRSFVLPCGSDAAARLHLARNEVRKAEVALLELKNTKAHVRDEILIFFNRLSDLLFVLARFANQEAGEPDILWNGALEE